MFLCSRARPKDFDNLPTRISDERGVATVEAALVSMGLLPLIFMSIYFNLLTFRMNSAHYLIQNSLRAFSYGPQDGLTNIQSSNKFIQELVRDMKNFAGVNPDNYLFRNDFGCFKASANGVSSVRVVDPQRNCPPRLPIPDTNGLLAPNAFVSVEIEVKLFEQELFGIEFPKARVVSGMKMGAF